MRQHWKLKRVPTTAAKKLLGGPMRHDGLSEGLLAIARETYATVGHFIQPTFEQWEMGFLRDTNPDRELALWQAMAESFTQRCQEMGRNPGTMSKDEFMEIFNPILITANEEHPLVIVKP
jgi:hypothetical protein